MLHAEPVNHYYVWPSWANGFTFDWKELPRMLEDPLNSGHLDQSSLDAIRRGLLVPTCEEYEIIDGPFGNGIVRYERIPGHNWLGTEFFFNDAEISHPNGTLTGAADRIANVAYLHLRGDAGLRFFGEGRKKPKEYECCGTVEHAESAGDDVYWLVDINAGRNRIKGLDEVPAWAVEFGIFAEPLDDIPPQLVEETRSWFEDATRSRKWFRVRGGPGGAGIQLAMLVYLAMHLRMIGGSRIHGMHLVAQVEGKANSRPRWGRGK